jgi:hypothetical protein
MVFYAIALAPAGNIVRDIRSIIVSSSPGTKLHICHGLPIALYLGFYSGHTTAETQRQFVQSTPELFSSMPKALAFTRLDVCEKDVFAVSESPLGELKVKADRIAQAMNLKILEKPPIMPGIGFFIGHAVTSVQMKSFSFRHMDSILVACRIDSPEKISIQWKILSRVRRLLGPRHFAPRRGDSEFHDIVAKRDAPGH